MSSKVKSGKMEEHTNMPNVNETGEQQKRRAVTAESMAAKQRDISVSEFFAKNRHLHPMNYFFLAAAFFAFHLLLAYLVDHISIHLAFLICSAVSVFLVVSYLRLVVGPRFALVEAGTAQFIYLMLFSYAFFLHGFTGLAVTAGCIVTLFVVMQMTARIRWAEQFRHPLVSSPVQRD